MISLKDSVIVRLEIDFELIKGELGIFEQNALEQPPEKLITMWGDQVKRTNLMVLFRRLEKYGSKQKNRGRKGTDLG
jgi:hypothetical protein